MKSVRQKPRPASELAQMFRAMRTLGVVDRELYSSVLRKTLEANPAFLGAWSVWEPDAIDGRDAGFRDFPGHDRTGRFVPFWHRRLGCVTLAACTGYERPELADWYRIPKELCRLCVPDPYIYPIAGKPCLIASQVAPILIEDRCLGVTGVDFSLESYPEHILRSGALPAESNPMEEILDCGVVFLDRQGEVLYWTQRTREMIARYVSVQDERHLPVELAEIITRAGRRPSFQGIAARAIAKSLSFTRRHHSLSLRYIPLRRRYESLILVSEAVRRPGMHLQNQDALTCREQEVHFWLSQGKSNEEIGLILGISAHTVKNHLERIFQKLGVENRYAAALAWGGGNLPS